MADGPLRRRYGTPLWDGLVRGTGAVAAVAAVLALCWKDAAVLAGFVMLTVWVHGPLSPFLPVVYEPTLLLFGRLYAPLLIALLGTVGNLYVEFLDYWLFRMLGGFGPYRRLQDHPLFARAVRLFAKRPFLTVWVFAWSPLPDWMVRMIAPAARYPIGRYLVAMGLGRLPRFWLLAALGSWLLPPPWLLLAVAFGSAALTVVALAWKTLVARSPRTSSLTLAPDARPTTA